MTPACSICGSSNLTEVQGFFELCRVTSDCKAFRAAGELSECHDCGAAQKPDTAAWRHDCAEIYADYDNYSHTFGIEQSVRGGPDGRHFAPRSKLVLDAYQGTFSVPKVGRMLDYGCGKGPTSRAAAECFPGWTIDGYDLDRRAEAELRQIPGFDVLFTGTPSEIDNRYDLIVLMHALEHIPGGRKVLRELFNLLKPGGHIVIQVPNRIANPFDLLVADHTLHFDRQSLFRIADEASLPVALLSESWVAKELSMVLGPTSQAPEARPVALPVADQVSWLQAVSETARACAETADKLGIFGTSIVATWLRAEIGRTPDFYIDEDTAKQGLSIDGVPVLRPQDAPSGAVVLLAMAPTIAKNVVSRHGSLELQFVVFPEYSGEINHNGSK